MEKNKSDKRDKLSIIADPYFCLLCMSHSCKHKGRNKDAKTAFHHDRDNDHQSGRTKTRKSSKRSSE